MRQGQQNRRGRGRNRKSQNPLTRSFESTGPDVKIRGTAAHIAEKYMSLARDALSSGDPVLAENYMQHAEHYNRIIMSFREQQMSQGGDPFGRPRPMGPQDSLDGGDDFGDDDGDDMGGDMAAGAPQPDIGLLQQAPPQMQPTHQGRQYEHQPRYDNRQRHDQRYENRHGGHQGRSDRSENRFDRGERNDRNDRFDRRDHRGERGERNDRNDRPERGERPERAERQDFRGPDRPEERQPAMTPTPAPEAEAPAGNGAHAPAPHQPHRRRERYQPPQDRERAPAAAAEPHQPEFLRRPVRRPRREEGAPAEAAPRPASDDAE